MNRRVSYEMVGVHATVWLPGHAVWSTELPQDDDVGQFLIKTVGLPVSRHLRFRPECELEIKIGNAIMEQRVALLDFTVLGESTGGVLGLESELSNRDVEEVFHDFKDPLMLLLEPLIEEGQKAINPPEAGPVTVSMVTLWAYGYDAPVPYVDDGGSSYNLLGRVDMKKLWGDYENRQDFLIQPVRPLAGQ